MISPHKSSDICLEKVDSIQIAYESERISVSFHCGSGKYTISFYILVEPRRDLRDLI